MDAQYRHVLVDLHTHAVRSADCVPERVAHKLRGDKNGVVDPFRCGTSIEELSYVSARETRRLGAIRQLHPMTPYRHPPAEALFVHRVHRRFSFPLGTGSISLVTPEPRRYAAAPPLRALPDGGQTAC
jgi:hypothetical protein